MKRIKRWKIVVEDAKGIFRNRYTMADDLDGAIEAIRKRIPMTWRIVSGVEVSEDWKDER